MASQGMSSRESIMHASDWVEKAPELTSAFPWLEGRLLLSNYVIWLWPRSVLVQDLEMLSLWSSAPHFSIFTGRPVLVRRSNLQETFRLQIVKPKSKPFSKTAINPKILTQCHRLRSVIIALVKNLVRKPQSFIDSRDAHRRNCLVIYFFENSAGTGCSNS